MTYFTTLQVCSFNAITQTYTTVFDLNNLTSTFLTATKMDQPQKAIARGFNMRTPGEYISKQQYKNRHIQASVNIRGANTTALLATVRSLIAAIEQPPYYLKVQLPSGAQYSYIQVRAVTYTIPSDTMAILAGALHTISIDFECDPFFLGDWVTLQNVLMNPGFEAPATNPVTVFLDALNNADAYTVALGTAPSVSANAMTIPVSTCLTFGSPAWRSGIWTFLFTAASGMDMVFGANFTNISNLLGVTLTQTSFNVTQIINGINDTAQTAAISLTAGAEYWLQVYEFPVFNGAPAQITATLYTNNSGNLGTQVATITGMSFIAAYSGLSCLWNRAGSQTLVIGATGVSGSVQLFGPGGWWWNGGSGSVGICAGAWEQTVANTFSGGPVSSLGAFRIELPASGMWMCTLTNANLASAAQIAATASPVAPNMEYSLSFWMLAPNVGNNCYIESVVNLYDISGNYISSIVLTEQLGKTAAWRQTVASYTTPSNAYYCAFQIEMFDSVSAESPSATIWIDNGQMYAGAANSVPYCELRFPAGPAQLLVSGLLGDVAAPGTLAIGGLPAGGSLQPNSIFTAYVGRRQYAAQQTRIITPALCTSQDGFLQQQMAYPSALGGYIAAFAGASSNYSAVFVPASLQEYTGTYHLFCRALMQDSTYSTRTLQGGAYEAKNYWGGSPQQILGLAQTAAITPFTAQNTWQIIDCGVLTLPPFPKSDQIQLTHVEGLPYVQSTNAQFGMWVDWLALLPVETELIALTFQNPASSSAVSGWVWLYVDGSQPTQKSVSWSIEVTAAPNMQLSGGGPGTMQQTSPSVIATADESLLLDPTITTPSGISGVNQYIAFISDSAANVLNVVCELGYAPRYLYPR